VDQKSYNRQDPDDYFGSMYCTHEGPLKWVLDRNESLESKCDREPDAETRADRAAVDHGLTKALTIEEINTDVVQPDDQQG